VRFAGASERAPPRVRRARARRYLQLEWLDQDEDEDMLCHCEYAAQEKVELDRFHNLCFREHTKRLESDHRARVPPVAFADFANDDADDADDRDDFWQSAVDLDAAPDDDYFW